MTKLTHLGCTNLQVAKPGLYSLTAPTTPLDTLSPSSFFPTGHYRDSLVNSYCILLGKFPESLSISSVCIIYKRHYYRRVHYYTKNDSIYDLSFVGWQFTKSIIFLFNIYEVMNYLSKNYLTLLNW